MRGTKDARCTPRAAAAGAVAALMLVTAPTALAGESAAALAGGRAYELVSQPAKNLGEAVRVLRASEDAGAVAYAVTAAPSGATGAHIVSFWIAERGAERWVQRPADAPGGSFPFTQVRGLEINDFNTAFDESMQLTPAPLAGDDVVSNDDIFRVSVGSGAATWVTQPVGLPQDPTARPRYQGASADLSRVFFTMEFGTLLPDAPDGGLYEWHDGALRVVSVLPDGTPSAGYVATDHGSRSGIEGAPFSGGGTAVPQRGAHAVAADGSSVFWSPSSAANPLPIYFSRDGQPTVAVTASQRTGHEGVIERGLYIGASPDHGSVYFASSDQLVDGAIAAMELYRYDTATDDLTLLTPSGSGGTGAQVVNGIASGDGSHVYFTGYGALTPDAEEGALNAYVWSDGEVRFIATIEDGPPAATPVSRVARVAWDGTSAVIESPSRLTEADNAGHRALYLYDDVDGSLQCASCRPDGSPSEGYATVGEIGANTGGPLPTTPQANASAGAQRQRNLAADGRVFFLSTDQLDPRDVNDVYDVYEWRDGVTTLVSSGRSDYPSFLADNGDDGQDVFFLTRDRLVDEDVDEAYDVYDARLGGGFPRKPQPNVSPCAGDDCHGDAAPRPGLPGPSSLVDGGGNPSPKPDGVRPKARIRLAALTMAQRRGLVRFGSVMLAIKVTGGGLVRVRARAMIAGRMSTVGSAARKVRSSRTLTARLPLRLSHAARRQIKRSGRLTLTFEARRAGAAASRRTVTLVTNDQR